MGKPKGYILVHIGAVPNIIALDIVARKDISEKYKTMLKDELYIANCEYVKKFLKENPDYEYIGSEDLGHVPPFNASVLKLVTNLVKDGFEIKELWLY